MGVDGNIVDAQSAERNRTVGFPGGVAFSVACVRVGDHAHVEIVSGRSVYQPTRGWPHIQGGFAGKLILRWPEWLILRDVLAADERFYIAEVEKPTPAQARRYTAYP